MSDKRFVDQARDDYLGTPRRIARRTDRCGEVHVIIEMHVGEDTRHYLDWIGAELAEQPDEFDQPPFSDLSWTPIKEKRA